jgi:ribosomal protein L16 Arg81 hydroxylase
MWDRASDERCALAWLLQPTTVDEFFEHYYERAPLHIVRNRRGYYDDAFSLSELERILYGSEVGAGALILYQDGLPTRRESFVRSNKRTGERARDIVDADRVSALFANGCSLVLDGVQDHSDTMASLIRGLETTMRHRIGANVYTTPRQSQGFTAHYDTHDTVIMQIAGSKRWRIYGAPTELPLESQPHDKKKHAAGDVVMEIEIRPGDLLYLPRGVMHEARAGEDFSLHVTLGLYPALWSDVLREALDAAAASDVLLRKSATNRNHALAEAELAEIAARAFTPERLAAARERLGRAYLVERRNGLEGQLEQVLMLGDLSPASHVAVRPQMLYELEEGEDTARLSFSSKTLTLPRGAATIIRALEGAGAPSLGTLIGLDPHALEVVRKLISEGFLYVRRPDAADRAATG